MNVDDVKVMGDCSFMENWTFNIVAQAWVI